MRLMPPRPTLKTLSLPLKIIPGAIKSPMLSYALNTVFKKPLEEGDFDFLEHRCLKIEITDIDMDVYINFDGEQLIISQKNQPDVVFKGTSKALLALALREEDPDTLFFQRKLMIEGDTELGLGIKNLLDGIDLEQLPDWLQSMVILGNRVRSKIPAYPN